MRPVTVSHERASLSGLGFGSDFRASVPVSMNEVVFVFGCLVSEPLPSPIAQPLPREGRDHS